MGFISCEMSFKKPPDECYRQGEIVSGLIKYTILQPVEIQKITTSLKGMGTIKLQVHYGTKNRKTYKTNEVYVDIDNIVQNETVKMECGSREIKFSFILPHDIPSTTRICKTFEKYKATCVIKYYVRIKLEGPGLFAIDKHFRKQINVQTEVTPKLSREPITYAKTKKLVRLFSSKNGLINIKATILNSVMAFGGEIIVHYEVKNDSHVIIKSFVTKLMEVYTFKAEGRSAVAVEEEIPGTEAKTTAIKPNTARTDFIEINVSPNVYSLENSKIVSRSYNVRLIALMPFPHGQMIMNIPVQIGVNENADTTFDRENEYAIEDDQPPSYWEVICAKKEYEDSSEEDDENDKEQLNKILPEYSLKEKRGSKSK